jgi:hypothetical protein
VSAARAGTLAKAMAAANSVGRNRLMVFDIASGSQAGINLNAPMPKQNRKVIGPLKTFF